MVKSLVPGESSSGKNQVNSDIGAKHLAALCAQNPLSGVIKALGADADLHVVGGTVREALLNAPLSDLDISSRLPPEEASQRLSRAGYHVVETGLKHGTVTIVADGGIHLELTTFRKPGPHGVNNYSTTIEEDLAGRDFTINAIAWSVQRQQLVDPFKGIEDLNAHVVRCVGDATARLQEDPLRILRLVRFGPAQGRTIDKESWQAASVQGELLRKISVERIREELVRTLCSPYVRNAFVAMNELRLFPIIFPEILPTIGCEQNEFHTEDVFNHTMSVIERSESDRISRLIALFHDLGKPATLSVGEDGRRHFYEHEVISEKIGREVMERLRFSNDEIDQVTTVVRLHMRPTNCGAPGVRRILRDTGAYYDRWRRFKFADKPPVYSDDDTQNHLGAFDAMVETERQKLSKDGQVKLAINGGDLLQLGFKEGKLLGSILKEFEELVLEQPEQNNRELLLQKARQKLT